MMTLEDIKSINVKSIVDDNAHLYLWSPNSIIQQALEVMKAWGFEFKTVITWVKHRSIFGYYFKGQSEQLLFGVRGKLPPQNRCQVTIINGKNSKHSKKPEEQYNLIEKVSPGPRIELFARQKRDGWDCIGDAINGKDIREELKYMQRDEA